MIELDGSHGEGGGQILRSALALSILTGRPFKLVNIRANRKPSRAAAAAPHVVQAAGDICRATYKGGVGRVERRCTSSRARSRPASTPSRIGTAGATALVLHTVYLPLALRGDGRQRADDHRRHARLDHAPCYHFIETTWAAYLKRMGIEVELEMVRPGFYPRGGGEIRAVDPAVFARPRADAHDVPGADHRRRVQRGRRAAGVGRQAAGPAARRRG